MMRFALPKTLPQAATDAGVTLDSLRAVNSDLVKAINAAHEQVQGNGQTYQT